MNKITSHLVMNFDIGVNGNLFGGKMLSWIDEAGAMFLKDLYPDKNFVTLKIAETIFYKPVQVNQLITFFVEIIKIGNTSITFNIFAKSQQQQVVVSTEMVFVCIDKNGNKQSIN